jgi:hypothetical protein
MCGSFCLPFTVRISDGDINRYHGTLLQIDPMNLDCGNKIHCQESPPALKATLSIEDQEEVKCLPWIDS